MPPETQEVRRWLEKADHDRIGAVAALERNPPLTDIAAFHCQQAVEKTLKAYLVWRELEFEKVHDLERLIDDCGRYDAAFAALKPRVAPLSVYAVRFRYPGPADPSVEEVNVAMQAVQTVWKFVNDRLPPETRL
jgi:HEPN domain-containing protein